MAFFTPELLYIHLKTYFKILYLNCFKHFGFRRALFTIVMLYLWSLFGIILFVGRLLDEILYPKYRQVNIEKPIFIISNPRSGTTYLHRLLCLDSERYNYTLLYHTIFPSVTILRFIDFLGSIDRIIGSPGRKIADWIDDKAFDGWKDIHPTGINSSEEDEGMYIFPMLTVAICLLCPYIEEFEYLTIPDRLSPKIRDNLKRYFRSSIQRFHFATQPEKTLLSKNVISTGRLKIVLEAFPDARIIYPIRNPLKAVPSFSSMFAAPWKLHSPDIKLGSMQHRALSKIPIEFYQYFEDQRETLPAKNLYVVKYTEIVKQPYQVIQNIYAYFDIDTSLSFLQKLKPETSTSRTYKSKHSYNIEDFGYTKEEIETELSSIIQHYDL